MELDTKLYMIADDGEKFMGIGVLWLLEEIGKGKSLRAAAQDMGLSYSKAYAMVTRLESVVGRPMVERRRGGASREGLTLTAFAIKYMELYKDFQGKAKAAAQKEFLAYRSKVESLMEETENEA